MGSNHYKRPFSSTYLYILILASLLFLFFFLLSPTHNITTTPTPVTIQQYNEDKCDYSEGKWLYDPTSSPRYDHTCKEIYKGWKCADRSGAEDIVKWRWHPNHCPLPQFDPITFLQSHRDTSIGFVGDSLNRNMFLSLFCTLRRVTDQVNKWRPAGADRAFTFLKYNLTLAYHRTNLLARYATWSASPTPAHLESLGYKQGYRVDVDIPDRTWAEAPAFHHILIFNTGHWWWAPSKFHPVKSPMLFFKNGHPLIPPVSPEIGLRLVLKHMISYVEEKARPGTVLFFRSQSPRHFEGGDWNEGGSCKRLQPLSADEVENFFSVQNNGTNVETRVANQHLFEAIKGTAFRLLDITRMSEFRADAHPSSAGGKKHDDCMHWCLPGITDTWNDLFVARLSSIKVR